MTDGACARFDVLAAGGGIRSCGGRRLVLADYHPHTTKISAYPITQNWQVSVYMYNYAYFVLVSLLYMIIAFFSDIFRRLSSTPRTMEMVLKLFSSGKWQYVVFM